MSRAVLARREPLTVGLSAPLFTAVAAGLAVVGAGVDAALGGTAPVPAEAAGLALLVAAGAVLAVASLPSRAPVRARTHALVLALLAASLVLDAVGAPADGALQDGSTLIAVLLLQLPLALLRPALHVLVGGVLLAAGPAAAAAALAPAPLQAAHGAAAAAAVLAPSIAAAAFGRASLRRLGTAAPQDAGDQHGGEQGGDAVRLSVQQEAIARLEAEAVPLLDGVLARGVTTRADAARASAIAAALRAALLADLARGWLAEAGMAVDDPRGYAERMTAQQRTAVRTVLAALPLADPAHPGTASLTGQDRDAELVLELPLSTLPDRRRVSSLIPLLRAAFATAEVRIGADRATLTAAFAADD